MKYQRLLLVGISGISLSLACAGARVGGEPTTGPSGSGASGIGNGGNGGGGPKGPSGGGGSVGIKLDVAPLLKADPDAANEDTFPDTTGCTVDDAGNYNCCPKPLSILSIGRPGVTGKLAGKDDISAFQAFMNGNTKGTATMQTKLTYTPLTDELLKDYDLVILQAQQDNLYVSNMLWPYTQEDVDALNRWVRDKGGAVLTMSGYTGDSAEVGPVNKLLEPYGISYAKDDVYTEGACTDGKCYCSYGSIPYDSWKDGSPDLAAIANNHDGSKLGKVGIFRGRSVSCTGSDCQILATDTADKNIGVLKKVGNGRIFAWADEWVTYTSQWGLEPDPTYDDAKNYQQCVGRTPMTSYSVPQFWYNVFRWLVPGATCFTIIVPKTAPAGQQVIF